MSFVDNQNVFLLKLPISFIFTVNFRGIWTSKSFATFHWAFLDDFGLVGLGFMTYQPLLDIQCQILAQSAVAVEYTDCFSAEG